MTACPVSGVLSTKLSVGARHMHSGEPMSFACCRATRYCERAKECLKMVASSQTPGSAGIHLILAEQYLLLAQREIKASNPIEGIRREFNQAASSSGTDHCFD